MERKDININEITTNEGQIEGLPKNPRFIRDERYKKLKKSIEDAPEMLQYRTLLVYPHEDKYVAICGNMRLRACRELKYKTLPCVVLPSGTTAEKLREYTVKDNIAFGENDWDEFANEWDETELEDWGFEWNDIKDGGEPQQDENQTKEQSFVIEVICDSEQEQNDIFSKLDADGLNVRFGK